MRVDAQSAENDLQKCNHQTGYAKPVWVQGEGYRCLATLDNKGRWRAFVSGKELSGTVRLVADQISQ
jgi:hypothetical protein